jgi:hypothetical protein
MNPDTNKVTTITINQIKESDICFFKMMSILLLASQYEGTPAMILTIGAGIYCVLGFFSK